MKKTVAFASIALLVLGACELPRLPLPASPQPADQAGTQTGVAQTLAAQPTVTAPPTSTPRLPVSPTASEAPTTSPTSTADLTMTPATATLGPVDLSPTATLAAAAATSIPTLTIRLYGTMPPAVPFSRITLVNKARTQAYISLQVTSNDGNYAILEYPVEGRMEIKAPIGSYLYVAWVGGNKMVGNFRLHGNEDLTITLLRDRVLIQ